MFFDDAVDQGQAESGALVGSFGGIEGLENMIELVFGDPGTLVGDLDDSGVSLAVSTDADQPALGGSVPGIGQQVDEYLYQALFVPQHHEMDSSTQRRMVTGS